jgi:hypothetical protein
MYGKVCVSGLLVGCLALAACNEHELAAVDPNRQTESYKDVPVDNNRDLDILFVIDNSQSMGEEQESLTANFSRFIEVLEGLDGGLPNVHIGVISTDVGAGDHGIGGCVDEGDSGRLQSVPRGECQPPAGGFIRDTALPGGERDRNYAGPLADTFSCIARLGIEGCGFEQPLEAMKRALDDSNPGNRFFLRDNAFLLVVFITDEDDCSAITTEAFDPEADALGPISSFRCFEYGVECDEPISRDPGSYSSCRPREDSEYIKSVAPYVDFLKGLKADPTMIMVAGIVGDPTPVEVDLDLEDRPELMPSCTSGSGVAAPAVRLNWFFEQFPDRSTVTTICNDDLSTALELVAQQILPVLSPCIEGNIDIDPNTEGTQFDCVVSDVRFPGEERQEETPLYQCDSVPPATDDMPCWHMEHRPDTCPSTATQMSLIVERDGTSVPSGTHTIVRCRVIE